MTQPLLLDLFCGAGGSAVGYARAGFKVIGVDMEPQPNYPFNMVVGDAMEYLDSLWTGVFFDAVHASPPCQSYSRALKHLAAPQPMLIEPIRELLDSTGLPYIIENVPGAPLKNPVQLCGTSFGLRVYRHRLFETNFPVEPLECQHKELAMNPHNVKGRERIYAEFGERKNSEKIWAKEMGVDCWMKTKHEVRECIPPVYTDYIGKYALEAMRY